MAKVAPKTPGKKKKGVVGPEPLSLPVTLSIFVLTIGVAYVWLCGWPIDTALVPGNDQLSFIILYRLQDADPFLCF